VGAHKVRREKGQGKNRGYIFFQWKKETKIINWERNFLYTTEEYQQLKRVEFIGDSISYVVLRGHWYIIIVLNMNAPTEERRDYSKDSFYEKLRLCELK